MFADLGEVRNRSKRVALIFVLAQILSCIPLLLASDSAVTRMAEGTESGAAPTLVIGFMGGFVHSDDLRHSEAHLPSISGTSTATACAWRCSKTGKDRRLIG